MSRESCCSRCNNVDHRKFVHWSSDCNSWLFLIILEIHFSDFLVIFMPFSNKDIILNNWIPLKKKNEFQVRISLVSKCIKLEWTSDYFQYRRLTNSVIKHGNLQQSLVINIFVQPKIKYLGQIWVFFSHDYSRTNLLQKFWTKNFDWCGTGLN